MALVPEPRRSPSADDIRLLLRKRLLFLALLTSAFLLVTAVTISSTDLPLDVWAFVPVVSFTPGPVLAHILWWRRALSVRELRVIELILFGSLYVMWASVHGFLYPTLHLAGPPVWFGFLLGCAVSLPWGFLILLYGILIPNTWRRCTAVVGVMAVTPLAISKANGLAAQATAGHSEVNYFLVVAICQAAAAALAIYGSHRIEVLRREAVAARRLDQYRLGRRLGAGGMGEVYLAEHWRLERPCAVKLIRPEKAGDSVVLQRFEREVQAMTRLTHGNVVEVLDYGRTDDGTFYYVMEYLPGLTLEEMVKRHGPLPTRRAVHLLRQVCAALREAHAKGLIHRDLKPGNVIVGERGGVHDVAKLLDFGLVQGPSLGDTDDRLTVYGALVGTPTYMSPEQARGSGELLPASDLYSLGALGYYLLTGRPPFVRTSVMQTVAAHIMDPAVPPSLLRPDVPADLQEVILTCLAKDPGRRFPDAAGVEHALARCACAGAWSQADAQAWWQAQAGELAAAVDGSTRDEKSPGPP